MSEFEEDLRFFLTCEKDSGLPTFRDKEGFWRAYPPARKSGRHFAEVSNPKTFREDARLAWGFFGHRYQLYNNAIPHRGYSILLELSSKVKDFFVFTSNVDGAFEKAGFPVEKIVECHGSIHYVQALNTNESLDIIPATETTLPELVIEEGTFLAQGTLPFLIDSSNEKIKARPNILMFDDDDFLSTHLDQQNLRMAKFLNKVPRNSNLVVIEIGAGNAVPTVRYTSEFVLAKFPKSKLIRINIDESEGPERTVSIPMAGKVAMEAILEAMMNLDSS